MIVNPHDTDNVAEAIHTALNMPLEERQNRWRRLSEVTREQDIGWWREQFLNDLAPGGLN